MIYIVPTTQSSYSDYWFNHVNWYLEPPNPDSPHPVYYDEWGNSEVVYSAPRLVVGPNDRLVIATEVIT